MDNDELRRAERNDLDDSSASRALSNAIREDDPGTAAARGQAVYGDTDMNPLEEEQQSMHRAGRDEHL
ncbi:MAG: hypothetical protein NVS1B14_09090 [Vulcanimicrobiaceae bacterium]